jgi:ABC-type uncharacterized transport system substrate-binding protein
VACLWLLLTGQALAAPSAVTVVQGEEGGAYLEFANALREIFSGRGIQVDFIDAAKPVPSGRVVIAVGSKAAATVASSDAAVVLNVLIAKSGYEKLLRDFPQRARARNFSAIYLDQPVHRHANLLAAALPGKHEVGLLYFNPPDNLAYLKQAFGKRGLSLREQKISLNLPLPDALSALLQESDILLALPDAMVYNSLTIRNILMTSYRSNVPLVGFSPAYVKAGALCAVFSTPAQIAAQADKLIRQLDEVGELPPAQYPQDFEVMVNEQVARSLGLQIPGAPVLRDEMKSLERGGP